MMCGFVADESAVSRLDLRDRVQRSTRIGEERAEPGSLKKTQSIECPGMGANETREKLTLCTFRGDEVREGCCMMTGTTSGVSSFPLLNHRHHQANIEILRVGMGS